MQSGEGGKVEGADYSAVTDFERAMRGAIGATHLTYPHPNPRVGALFINSDGEIISTGAHISRGSPHAEVVALDSVTDPSDGHLVITLEPCNHHGLTPPCTERIIESGVRSVIIGALDPDSRVSGRGVARLVDAGLEVTTGVLADEVEANDPGYFHHRRTGRPLITLKLATTLDGQSGAVDGTSQWITSEESRADAHRLRSENDAIIVGAGTVVADDPALTVRIEGFRGVQPRPVIIAGRREISSEMQVMKREPIIYGATGSLMVDPVEVVQDLGERGILSAMVEGGSSVAASFLSCGVVDRLVWYIGANLAAGIGIPAISGNFATMGDLLDLVIEDVARVGSDIRVTATLSPGSSFGSGSDRGSVGEINNDESSAGESRDVEESTGSQVVVEPESAKSLDSSAGATGETLIARVSSASLPTRYGVFRILGYRSIENSSPHIALVMGDVSGAVRVLTRVHSVCLTGDVFGSIRCDCGAQLDESMRLIAAKGEGVILYNTSHEGRGIGILDKISAYDLQDHGLDTVEANIEMGHENDLRSYRVDAQILADLRVSSITLLTNNPDKVAQLEMHSVEVDGREPLWVGETVENRTYLDTKTGKMGHIFE